MAIQFISEPDKVALSKDPMDWQVADNTSVERLKLLLFMESRLGLGDFEEVYDEERIHAQAYDYPVYPFSEAVNSQLAYELPPSGSTIHFLPKQVMKRCFAVSPIPFLGETSPTGHIANNAYQYEIMGAPLEAMKAYRIVADYREDYNSGNSNTLILAGSGELEFFKGREFVHDGKVMEIIYTEFAYDSIRLNHDNWQVDFYELDMQIVYALKGAWHFSDFIGRNTTLPAGRSILSTMPLERSYQLGQESWAWLLIENDSTEENISAECLIQYEDGSTAPFQYSFPGGLPEYSIIALPLHKVAEEAADLDPDKTIASLQIEFQPFDPQVQTNGNYDFSMLLKFDYDCFAHTREFHFVNSLGGTDSLITYGKGQETENTDAEEFRQHHQFNYSETKFFGDSYYANTYPSHARQFGRIVHSTRRAFKVAIGYRSEVERDAARDLIRSEFAFIREYGKLLPINIISPKTDFPKDSDRRYTLSFEYSYAFEEGGLKPQ